MINMPSINKFDLTKQILSFKQDTTDGSLDDTEATNEGTAMESDITAHAIGIFIAYSLVNTYLSQLCKCFYKKTKTSLL